MDITTLENCLWEAGYNILGRCWRLRDTRPMSPEGPDGGVDICVGKGPMGFDSPKLRVQVKSSDDPTKEVEL